MASGTLGADELPREKHKWGENSKVYTRKVFRNPKKLNSSSAVIAEAEVGSNGKPVGKGDVGIKERAAVVANGVGLVCNGVERNGGSAGETSDVSGVETSERSAEETTERSGGETHVRIDVEANGDVRVDIKASGNDRADTGANGIDRIGVVANGNDRIDVESTGNERVDVEASGSDQVDIEANGNDRIDIDTNGNDRIDVEANGNDRVDIEANGNDRVDIEANGSDRVDVEASGNDIVDIEGNGNDGIDAQKNNGSGTETDDRMEVESNGGDNHVVNGKVPSSSGGDTEEMIVEEEPEKSSSPRLPSEEANSPQHQQKQNSPQHQQQENSPQHQQQENSPQHQQQDPSHPEQNQLHTETVTLSEDSSSLNRVGVPLPNGHDHDGGMVNGVVREERPLVSQVDDRLNISVSAATSKDEVRELKRKLEYELEEVRKMARKVEAKESELVSISFGLDVPVVSRPPETPVAPVVRMRFPVNGGMENDFDGARVNQDLGSVSFNSSRPFRQLSVAVRENHHGVGEFVAEKEKRTPKANQYYRNSDFLLGKEKLPPAESHRKSKSSGGRKHSGGEFDYASGIDKKIFKKCSDLLQKLMTHKHGWVFNYPVDAKALGLHDYFDIIKHPMDLGTVKSRLANNWYKTPREFAEDVRLTFDNAMTYNPAGQDVHVMAKDLLGIFEARWPAIESDYDRTLRYQKMRELGTPTPTSRKSYPPAHFHMHVPLPSPPILQAAPFQDPRHLERSQSMPVRREPKPKPKPAYSLPRIAAPKKPKAKDPNKRDMTFDEKQKLSANLQGLPSEKLDSIVQIIKKRNSALSQHEDEIEVDIDNVDTETLWELDRFVTNYKKSLSKHKRRAEVAMEKAAAAEAAAAAAAAAAAQAPQETTPAPAPAPANTEVPGENTTGNVAPSPHVQQQAESDTSSSSSSSSSDSGSSSSDSDSDSSSNSDSDED